MPLRLSQSYRSCLLAICGVVAIGSWQSWQIRHIDEQQPYEPLVRTAVNGPDGSVTCAECHQTACEHISAAPHGTTLSSGNEPWILERFAGKTFSFADIGPVVKFTERDRALWIESDAAPEALRVDWMFGSGRHALTPVSLLTNPSGETELIEGSVSWYPPGVLGLTPGARGAGAIGMGCLGSHQDHRTTQECFGCHVTRLPMDGGRIATETMLRGVSCDRCHPGGEQHAQAMRESRPDPMPRWSDLTPLESVNRCGECHRRADQLTEAELRPDRTVLVRFASVGLTMSECFLQQSDVLTTGQSARLDCLTCHDPHQSAEQATEFYTRKCVTCHGASASQAAECSSSNTGSDCLSCHMPKVNVADKLALTDHWIRVRKTTDPVTVNAKPQ